MTEQPLSQTASPRLRGDHGGAATPLWWLAILAVVALAAALRFYHLDSLPPGLHYDQAHDVILSWQTRLGEMRPIFYTGFTGAEPLFLYSTAAVMAALGPTARALHVTSALYGLLTVVVTYFTARELFGGVSAWRGRWTGLLAMGFLATSGWHLLSSRNGFRAISLPLFEALAVWAMWAAFRSGRRAWWLAAGAALGATAYTYSASRLTPVAVGLFLVWLAVKDWRLVRANLGGLALMLGTALLVFAPLGLFFAQNPDYLFVRADQAWVFSDQLSDGDPSAALRDNVTAVLGMFFLKGDHNWRFNIAPRPIFDALMAALAGVGLLLCGWRAVAGEPGGATARERRPLPSQAPYVVTLLFIAVMLVPSLLSIEGRPNSLRAIGILPFLVFLPAVAVVAGLEGLRRWWSPRQVSVAAALVVVALIGYQTIATSQAYFGYWANAADTYYHYDTDIVAMADAARAELAAGHSVVLATEHYKHPTLAWEAPETLAQAAWVDPNAGIVYPGGNRDVVYLLARGTLQPTARFNRFLQDQGATFETLATDPSGAPSLVAARLSRAALPTAAQLADDSGPPRSMGGDLWLLGGSMPESRKRDGRLRGEVAWQVQRATSEPRSLAVRLVDDQGVVWGQSDVTAYLSEQWRPGDGGLQFFDMRLDPAMPPGRYTVQAALSDADRQPLPITDGTGAPLGLWGDVGTVVMEAEGGVMQAVGQGTPFGPGLQSLGLDRLNATLPPGGQIAAAVTWQRTVGAPVDTARLDWLDQVGRVAAEQPFALAPTYPPAQWRVGEVLRPRYRLIVPPTLAPGEYTPRLVAADGATLDLGRVTVAGGPRRFEVGPVQRPRDDRLGASLALAGYDLASEQGTAGQPVGVTLYWRALAAPLADSTRFLHLVDAGGALRAQTDGTPANGQRPTSGWLANEVVTDAVSLSLPSDLPAGRYRLLTGLYDPATLARLPARDATGQPWPDDAVVLGEVEVTR